MKNVLIVVLVALAGFIMLSMMRKKQAATLPVQTQFSYPPNPAYIPIGANDQIKMNAAGLLFKQGSNWLSKTLKGTTQTVGEKAVADELNDLSAVF